MKWVYLSLLFLSIKSFAAGETPELFVLDGQLFDSSGTNTLKDDNIQIRLRILDQSKTCVLYEETQQISTLATNGNFNIDVGSELLSPKRVSGSDPGNSMVQVFQNSFDIVAENCAGNLASKTPFSSRYLEIMVTPSVSSSFTLSPELILGNYPSALIANSIQGLSASEILQVRPAGNLTQANMENIFSVSNYPILESLAAGGLPIAGASTLSFSTSGLVRFEISNNGTLNIDNNTFVVNPVTKRIGLGTVTPSFTIGFASGSQKTIGIDNSLAGNGSDLSINAGGSHTVADTIGGDLYLKSGDSTGSQGSQIFFQTASPGSAGSGTNLPNTKLVITRNGDVGIGTTSPLSKLDVTTGMVIGSYAGSIVAPSSGLLLSENLGVGVSSNLQDKVTVNGVIKSNVGGFEFPDGSLLTTQRAIVGGQSSTTDLNVVADTDVNGSGEINLSTRNTVRVKIVNSGRIGLGVTSPNLSVSLGPTSARKIWMERNTVSDSNGFPLTFSAGGAGKDSLDTDGGSLILEAGTSTGTATSSITAATGAPGTSGTADVTPGIRFNILGDKLGFLVTTPVAKFQVTNTGAGEFSPMPGAPNPAGFFGFNTVYNGTSFVVSGDSANNGGAMLSGDTAGKFHFNSFARNGGAAQTFTDIQNNYSMSISPNGRLFIGSNGAAAQDTVHISPFASRNAGLRFENFAGTSFVFHSTGTIDSLGSGYFRLLRSAGSAVTFMTSTSSGNVTMGTSVTSGRKLSVEGDLEILQSESLFFDSTEICTIAGCVSPSDKRLKKDVLALSPQTEKLLQTQGVSYNWIDKKIFGEDRQIGFIAQDMEKIYPEVVETDKKYETKSIKYSLVVAPLVQGLKELFNKISRLQSVQKNDSEILGIKSQEIKQIQVSQSHLSDQMKSSSSRIDKLKTRMAELEKSASHIRKYE